MRRLTASEREAFLNEPRIATICVAGNSRPPSPLPAGTTTDRVAT